MRRSYKTSKMGLFEETAFYHMSLNLAESVENRGFYRTDLKNVKNIVELS